MRKESEIEMGDSGSNPLVERGKVGTARRWKKTEERRRYGSREWHLRSNRCRHVRAGRLLEMQAAPSGPISFELCVSSQHLHARTHGYNVLEECNDGFT